MSSKQFSYEMRDGIALVMFDSGGMNTVSGSVVSELGDLVCELDHKELRGVILRGNKFGLGSGANIGELMHADRQDLADLIDRGHEVLFRIEENRVPWLALIDGFALGGIYEIALACRGIICTKRSKVGFPEIRLNIIPGLGGTQRGPRRMGLVNMADPTADAGFTAILQAKNYEGPQALAMRMVDAVIPNGEDPETFAIRFFEETLPTIDRTPPPDLAQAETFIPMVLPMIQKATMGRPNPRAPYEALEVMVKGAVLPLREAVQLERDAFLNVATSSEGKAGMRFFFAQQTTQKLPKDFPGKPQPIRHVVVAGADGFMGNAILYLALEGGYNAIALVPLSQFVDKVIPGLRAKYAFALKKGTTTEEAVETKLNTVPITSHLPDILDGDLVIEALSENREIKGGFYRNLGQELKPTGLAASNSSSMGPSIIVPFFTEKGGDPTNYLNLHFFGPADRMPLVEIVVGEQTSPDTIATAHEFCRKIGKTPVILKDGSIGFLVNAGLAVYLEEAEKIYAEGTPIESIDVAMRRIFPMGPFEVCDSSGVDVAAGMFDTIVAAGQSTSATLIAKLRELGRLGKKTGSGFYDYDQPGEKGKKLGSFSGLSDILSRGTSVASEDEIVERCLRALHKKARELVDRGIVASAEECDLAFVMGIGFAMYLGGPIFYAQQQGWE